MQTGRLRVSACAKLSRVTVVYGSRNGNRTFLHHDLSHYFVNIVLMNNRVYNVAAVCTRLSVT